MVVMCYSDSLSNYSNFNYELYLGEQKIEKNSVLNNGVFWLYLNDSLLYRLKLSNTSGYMNYEYEFYGHSYDTLRVHIERIVEVY